VCVSKTVANELAEWVMKNGAVRQRPLRINWSHNGADVNNLVSSKGHSPDMDALCDCLRSRSTILMVGTLEPRKGHAQVLEAFEQLWHSGVDVNLVIVGRRGWLVDALLAQLRIHPELNGRLFWLDGISDEYLEKVYAASTCLIAASYGEGFGLPLIEAAQHKLPIIARDIPVFREVAGEHAFYFDGTKKGELASRILDWLSLHEGGRYPKSEMLPWITWSQSALNMIDIILRS
jgi:glycosyltransferase involved in cell wall biosynthesis